MSQTSMRHLGGSVARQQAPPRPSEAGAHSTRFLLHGLYTNRLRPHPNPSPFYEWRGALSRLRRGVGLIPFSDEVNSVAHGGSQFARVANVLCI